MNPLVSEAIAKVGWTVQTLFHKAYLDTFGHSSPMDVNYKILAFTNHGTLPDIVSDYCLDIIADRVTIPPRR